MHACSSRNLYQEWVIQYKWGVGPGSRDITPQPPPSLPHSTPTFHRILIVSLSSEPKNHVHAAARVDDVAHPAHPQAEARLLERRLHFFPAEEPNKVSETTGYFVKEDESKRRHRRYDE